MKPYLVPTKLMTDAEKTTGTRLEVVELTKAVLMGWKTPPFQRPLRTNTQRFQDVVTQVKRDSVLPGVITLAVVDKVTYILDGQHRIQAFVVTELPMAYADVRVHHFETLADAGEEWVRLNSQLVRMTPDDVLRALENSSEALSLIRKKCPFVGYDRIRRNTDAPLVSMSMILRAWKGSEPEVPTNGGVSAFETAKNLTKDDAEELVTVLNLFYSAWGRDPEYWRLWGALNVVICMWLYRRMVLTTYSVRSSKLTRDQFRKCMMSLSAAADYIEWLVGRQLRDTDRSPAYQRIRGAMLNRMAEEGIKLTFPAPAWFNNSGRRIP